MDHIGRERRKEKQRKVEEREERSRGEVDETEKGFRREGRCVFLNMEVKVNNRAT